MTQNLLTLYKPLTVLLEAAVANGSKTKRSQQLVDGRNNASCKGKRKLNLTRLNSLPITLVSS